MHRLASSALSAIESAMVKWLTVHRLHSSDPIKRLAAAFELAKVNDAAGIHCLLHDFRDALQQRLAAQYLSQLPFDAIASPLAQIINEQDTDFQTVEMAMSILGGFVGNSEAIRILASQLDKPARRQNCSEFARYGRCSHSASHERELRVAAVNALERAGWQPQTQWQSLVYSLARMDYTALAKGNSTAIQLLSVEMAAARVMLTPQLAEALASSSLESAH